MLTVSLILLLVNIILMLFFYWKVSRNFSENAYRDTMRKEVNRLIIDIEHESDTAITLLEDKIQRIEKLLADTDKHLLLIETEQGKWARQNDVMQTFHSPSVPVPDNQQPATEAHNSASAAEQHKNDSITIYTKQIHPHPEMAKTSLNVSLREQVIDFAKKGFSLEFIAEKVDLPLGEIELILSMNA
ncbi:MAG: hypothetical protein ACTTH7_08160 [Treponema sp.]